ncbi:SRPBCC family protein [Marinoscillum sp.]|uniref:SRPBCC family protein n=1 Tax=Marinoscillum sp. TaxID=2024838 RepID=UPI003BA8E8FB
MTTEKTTITIQTSIKAAIEKVWQLWSNPADITKWSTPSPDWHTTKAENDLRTGGKFLSRMEAKDGSFGFDFSGVYDQVKTHQQMDYTLDDGRKVQITFAVQGSETTITQTFEPEAENPIEMQREGWQAILNNFKQYAEAQKG